MAHRTLTRILLALFLVLVTGCSAAHRAGVARGLDQGLNVATDIVDPAYHGAVEVCDWTEGEIVRRHAPDDGEAAAAAMREARAMCDGLFASFEAARGAQATARQLAAMLRDDRATELEALAAAREAQEAYGAVKDAMADFRAWRAERSLMPPRQ
jgi:hypothetical protein